MSTMGSITSIAIQVKPHVRESATQTESVKQHNSKINPKIRKCYFCKGPHKVRDCELSKLTQKQVRSYQDAEPSRQKEKGNKYPNQAQPEKQENRGYLHIQEDSGPEVQEAADSPMQLEKRREEESVNSQCPYSKTRCASAKMTATVNLKHPQKSSKQTWTYLVQIEESSMKQR